MNTTLRSSVGILLVQLAASLGLAGCAQQPVEEAAATTEAGYGRAFGRVEFVEEGKEAVWTS
jgi:hypothetical protein